MREVILALALAALLVGTAAAQPAISVNPGRVDFGDLKPHESKQSNVIIKNVGTALLKIHQVETTCGCTVAELEKEELQPGESTTLVIDFNSKEFQGEQAKHVTIFSNDPRSGAFDLMILADVKVPLYWDQPYRNVGFETTRVGTRNVKEWNFWTEEVPQLKMTVEHKPDWVDIKVENGVGGDKQKSRVTFTLRDDTPPGRHRDSITLATNIPSEPAFVAEIATLVTQDLLLGTDRVTFNYVQPGQTLRTRVRVGASERTTKFKLTGAEIDIPGLKASIENTIVGEEGFAIIEGTALPKGNPELVKNNGRVKGKLKIFSDLPSTPVLEVEVTYMVRL